MSRVCVKNLPSYLTEERLREHFGARGEVTDVKIMRTSDGRSRQFAFVGYRTEEDATSSVSFFNRSFIDTSRLTCESCHLCQVCMKIHERRIWGDVLSKVNTSIGTEGGVKIPYLWHSASSKYLLVCHVNTQCESSSSKAKHAADERSYSFNRLLYRSRQRGYLELDLILGKWTEENIGKLDDKKLKSLVEVLDLENPELWKWLTGQEATPEFLTANPVFMEIHEKIMGALKAHSPSETRTKLGQSWVHGWDDNRKIGGPQVGNQ